MASARPLRIPSESQIRRAFNRWDRPPPELLDFMFTIGPIVKDLFITHTIATAVTHIGSMQADRKIKYLDTLLEEVNFPREVAREINLVVDLVQPPLEYTRVAERLVPPLTNLTGAMARPKDSVPHQAYQEAIISFSALRNQFVRELSYAFISHICAHPSQRERALEYAVERTIERVRTFDMAADVCDRTLRASAVWEKQAVAPLQVVTMLNASKARDAEVQQQVDDHVTIGLERSVLALIDDLIIAHCQRVISARSQRLQTLAFWEQVLKDAPASA